MEEIPVNGLAHSSAPNTCLIRASSLKSRHRLKREEFGMSTTKAASAETHPQLLMTGLAFGESPRWHDGRLWVSDWGTREIIALVSAGHSEVMVRLDFQSFQAICMDWLPDGRLLIVSSAEGR